MALISLALLGGFRARLEAGPALTLPTRKAQAVLAYLAVPLGRAHPRDKLAALLWGDRPETLARTSLRQTLFILRKALAGQTSAWLHLDGGALALNPAAVDVDVSRFEQRLADGTPAALAEAVTLYQGNLLQGLAVEEPLFEEWLLLERERLREAALEGLARLLAHQRGTGANEAAIQTGLRLLALDPLQESCHRALMQLYARLGRRDAALRQYEHCVDVLRRELHTEPEAETSALYQEILRRRQATPLIRSEVDRTGEEAAGPPPRAEPLPTETPLVGRTAELETLLSALDAARRGRGRAIAVLGEAGIGKTRLVTELVARTAGIPCAVLLGRAHEPDRILPFGPWVDALRSARVTEDATLLAELGPAWRAELGRLLPEVRGAEPPVGSPEPLALFEALARLVGCLAARHGALVVVEDLHWADDMSVRFLAFLARRLAAWRLLLVLSVRDEEVDQASDLGRTIDDLVGRGHVAALRLGPLTQPDTLALVRALVDSRDGTRDPVTLGDEVWAASEGHPLLVLERIRALDGQPQPASTLVQSPPPTLREVIGRRLGVLSERARRLVAVAAVAGRACDFGLLARVTDLDEVLAAEGVEELVRRRVLRTVGDRLEFAHDRIRDVTKAEILPLRRAALHRRLAEAMEALYAADLDSYCLAIGTHYADGEVWAKAVPFLRRAGAAAADRSAYREAAASFEQALAALEHCPSERATTEQAIDLRLDLARAYQPLGRHGERLVLAEEAERLAVAIGDPARLGWAHRGMAAVLYSLYQFDRAIAYGERALAAAEALGDRALSVQASYVLGLTHLDAGRSDLAIDLFRAVTTLAAAHASTESVAHGSYAHLRPAALAWLGTALAHVGQFSEAVARAEEALRLAPDTRPHDVLRALHCLGLVHCHRGDVAAARPLFERELALARSTENQDWLAAAHAGLGRALASAGQGEEAVGLLERAIAMERAGTGVVPAYRMRQLGEAYLAAGRVEEALERGREALAELARRGKPGGAAAAGALALVGAALAAREPPNFADAETHYREALELATPLGLAPLIARCHLGLGRLDRRQGDLRQAREHLDTALVTLKTMGMTLWAEQAEREREALTNG
jgi:DNA-binding SARP family transcriptional activator